MENVSLERRCALVTGASAGGLGYAIAEALAGAGASVVLTSLCTPEEGEAARSALARRFGNATLFRRADLARVDEIEELAKAAIEAFGSIDIVVNNAVVRNFAAVESLDPRNWDQSIAVNLSAAFHTIRLALPGMRRNGWGRIINISSVYGLSATRNRADYITTKTGLIGLTRAVALETADASITCNALCPGTLPTPAIQSRIASSAAEQGITRESATRGYLADRQPTGRFVSMESVAAMVLLLCSGAGADITGAVLPVDGGWTAS